MALTFKYMAAELSYVRIKTISEKKRNSIRRFRDSFL